MFFVPLPRRAYSELTLARRRDATAINEFALIFPDASRMGIAVRSVPCPTIRITARADIAI